MATTSSDPVAARLLSIGHGALLEQLLQDQIMERDLRCACVPHSLTTPVLGTTRPCRASRTPSQLAAVRRRLLAHFGVASSVGSMHHAMREHLIVHLMELPPDESTADDSHVAEGGSSDVSSTLTTVTSEPSSTRPEAALTPDADGAPAQSTGGHSSSG